MLTQDKLLDRITLLEDLLEDYLNLFHTSTKPGNSTFEGGLSILDIEVSDDVEQLLEETEELLALDIDEDEDSEGE